MERNCSEEHEEGEIIDDFEDISDYSIPSTSYSGKSVSHQDLLQGVSLSSISDNEPDSLIYETYSSRHKHAKRRRRSVHGHRRKRHKPIEYYSRQHRFHRYTQHSSHNSDSSDGEVDITMQKQLKEAIRIDTSHIQQNSLRTRLKAMLHPDDAQEEKIDDEDAEALRALALLSNVKDETKDIPKNDVESADEKDDELIELRLAALKSAVLKKAPEIRKRKRKQQPNPDEKVCEVNKENDANQENNNIVADNVGSVESVDHNKTEIDSSRSISVDEDIDIMRAKLLASMSKKIASDLPIQNSIVVSKENHIKPIVIEKNKFSKHQLTVKPLIINLNDSDSDTDVTTVKEPGNVDEKELHLVNSVSAFLKKQRAAVEAKKIAQTDRKIALDKSVLKLLPKSQQKEYHLLKQKLLMAKRKRLRKNTCSVENGDGTTMVRKAIIQEVSIKRTTDSKPGLQKALDDIQIKKNGRLQMKGKYKALAPLLQKVNQASIERKQCELEIKTLLERLQKARDKLAVSHQNYTNLVMRLTSQKNAIDRRIAKMHTTKLIVNNNVKTTSTPIKRNIQESVCDISSIHNNSNEQNVKETTVVDSNKPNKDDVLPQIPHQQATDIELEIPKCDNDNNALKQYVSPLDSKNRDTVDDPLMTFCPYELFGVCKDSECKFNHCSKT